MNAIIVAMSSNRAIGREGGMPWHLPRDLKRTDREAMTPPCEGC